MMAENLLTWDDLLSFPIKKLYAGDIPSLNTYAGYIGLSLRENNKNHIKHDITRPFPIPDNCIDIFQSEDVFEHIEYEKIGRIIDEIFRILKLGGLFRLSVPDYNYDVLQNRSIKNSDGKIMSDPFVGGDIENPGHVWFPTIEIVKNLLETCQFNKPGKIEYLHYYNMDKTFIIKKIDYSKGPISRTPDFDGRVMNPRRPLSIVIDLKK
jgi:predicted SAM-dependent methyltransferase